MTLTASAGSNSSFAGWSGACSGTQSTCTLTMDSDKSVTATFNTSGGGGQASGNVDASPTSVQAGQSVTVSWSITCTGSYYDPRVQKRVNGSLVNDRYFTGSSGSASDVPSNNADDTVDYVGVCSIGSSKVAVDSATVNVTQPQQRRLNVSKTGDGTVTSNPAGINCGSDCWEPYNQGTQVTVTADPGPSWVFADISGDCGNASGGLGQTISVTCTMNANKNVYVVFDTISCVGDGCPPGYRCDRDPTINECRPYQY